MAPLLVVARHAVVAWDRATFLWMNRHLHCGPLNWTMPVVTEFGLGQVLAILIVLAALVGGWRAHEIRKGGLARGVTAAIARRKWWVGPLLLCLMFSASSDVVKAAVPRLRPWWFYVQEHQEGRFMNVHVLTVPGIDPLRVRGFPSGHTTSSVAIATGVSILFWRRPRGRALVLVVWGLALLVGFSRIYLASHWPLDVLGGIVLGIPSGAAGVWLARAWARWHAPGPVPGGAGSEAKGRHP